MDRREVSDICLKTQRSWPGGEVLAIDLGANDPVRARFTTEVHRRSVSAIRAYWQRMIFSGRDVPPVELSTAAEVVNQVADHPGAIGRVPEETVLPERVKAVALVR